MQSVSALQAQPRYYIYTGKYRGIENIVVATRVGDHFFMDIPAVDGHPYYFNVANNRFLPASITITDADLHTLKLILGSDAYFDGIITDVVPTKDMVTLKIVK